MILVWISYAGNAIVPRLVRQFVDLPCWAPPAHLCLALVLEVTLMLQSYYVKRRLRIYEELSCTCCVAVGTARAPVGAHAYLGVHGPCPVFL